MPGPPVHIVHLRRPDRSNPDERRTDPLFEFGSFGCTGCHGLTLMNPRHFDQIRGARLAFAQGGPLGFRLVYLTPPINPRAFEDRVEARWSPPEMPFRYADAPVLAANRFSGDFPSIERAARNTRRGTVEAGFSSLFRSRVSPLGESAATELIRAYDLARATAPPAAIARTYDEALPYPPPMPDRRRRTTYISLIRQLAGPTAVARRCSRGGKKAIDSGRRDLNPHGC